MSDKKMGKKAFLRSLPTGLQRSYNKELQDKVREFLHDDDLVENYKNNLLTMTPVLEAGSIRLKTYVNAVAYVSCKLLGYNNDKSFRRVFKKKVKQWEDYGRTKKQISRQVYAYNRTKLVVELLGTTLMPIHVINYRHLQTAIDRQVELLTCGNHTVEQRAADSLMTHLKVPESLEVEHNIKLEGTSMMNSLLEATQKLAAAQRTAIEMRQSTAGEVASVRIIAAEFEEKEDE